MAIVLALGFMGNMVQSNSISDAFHNAFGVNKLAVGIVVAVIAAFIFLGGVKRLASVTEKLVPVMALFYIVGCVFILITRWQLIPNAFEQIFVLAFQPQAIAGGVAGVTVREAMRYGVARGLFSNEAGMGSTPHAHALAKVEKPQDQGIIAMIGVFIDTFIVLSLTALVIITSGMIPTGLSGTMLTQAAFDQTMGNFGNIFIAITMFFFAFFHHHRVVLFRRGQLQGAVRQQGGAGVRRHCGAVCADRLGAAGGSGVEPVRPVQRPDGHPQPDRPAGTVRPGGPHPQGPGLRQRRPGQPKRQRRAGCPKLSVPGTLRGGPAAHRTVLAFLIVSDFLSKHPRGPCMAQGLLFLRRRLPGC